MAGMLTPPHEPTGMYPGGFVDLYAGSGGYGGAAAAVHSGPYAGSKRVRRSGYPHDGTVGGDRLVVPKPAHPLPVGVPLGAVRSPMLGISPGGTTELQGVEAGASTLAVTARQGADGGTSRGMKRTAGGAAVTPSGSAGGSSTTASTVEGAASARPRARAGSTGQTTTRRRYRPHRLYCRLPGCEYHVPFRDKHALQSHIKGVHRESLGLTPHPHKCSVPGCSHSYRQKSSLNRHVRADHVMAGAGPGRRRQKAAREMAARM